MGRPKGSTNKSKLEKGDKLKKFTIPWRFRQHENFDLATFIINKFLDARLIEKDVYKSYISALKLASKFSSKTFWQNLPANNKIKNISSLLFGKALERLTMFWNIYKQNLVRDKKIKIDIAPLIEYKLEAIDAEENMIAERKPKTILEFCK